MKKPKKESDLYEPIRLYLKRLGYKVQAEVNHCDITAMKDDELIIVELKLNFGVDLLVQAIDRQSITDSVYVALPGPISLKRKGVWQKRIRLLKQLEVGLITVNFGIGKPVVEIFAHPLPFKRRKNAHKKRAVLKELEGRSVSHNKAGVTRKKLLTAYRENAVLIACWLKERGPSSPKDLRALNTGPKTASILYVNHYKWFIRIGHGVYELSPKGEEELYDYPKLLKNIEKVIKKEVKRLANKE